jgi:Zn-dependent protease with chaperone function
MIAAGSLIGFGLVFLTASLAVSVVCSSCVLLFRRRLAAGGPAVERKAAAWTMALPPLLGLSVTLAIAGHSLLGRALGVPDHCPSDISHLHLCLYHGADWASRTWAVVVLAIVSIVAARGAFLRIRRLARARRSIGALSSLARAGSAPDSDVHVVHADRHFCFSAGIFHRRIFVSSAAWSRLEEGERRAVVAHERAHVEQGDVWRRAALGLLSLVGVPILTSMIMRLWEHSTERLCDHRAAQAVGDPTLVAQALMTFAAAPRPATPLAATFVDGTDVVGRIEALFSGVPEGFEAARRLGRAAVLVTAFAALGAVAAADPLHHAFETLLGT